MVLTIFQLVMCFVLEIKAGSELGRTAKEFIDNGQLIPDSLMIDILAATYDALPKEQGVIF